MSLIKCSECGKEVSSLAVSCPSCGNPIGAPKSAEASRPIEPVKPVEIEFTSKKWKKRIVFAIILLFIGLVMMPKSIGFGIFLMFVAFIIGLSARIGAWWTNG